jgi:hypothetical protein
VIVLLPRKAWLSIMAACKKKKVIQKELPKGRHVEQKENPDSYYDERPAWNFGSCDTEKWGFTRENVGELLWTEVLPFLKNLEAKTWKEILVVSKKSHHSIDVGKLNSSAKERMAARYIEQDSVISLRLTGTHRIYGYMMGRVFNILWYDPEHGDNDTCVCRSYLKHT